MMEMGLIRPGSSEWCSLIVLFPKSNGTQRFSIDYRKLNFVTKKDSFPLPRINDCSERIGKSKLITKLDLF